MIATCLHCHCCVIRVWYLPDNRQSCNFLWSRLSDRKISNILRCVRNCQQGTFPHKFWYATVTEAIMWLNMNCLYAVYVDRNQRAFLAQNDIICRAIWRHLSIIPSLSILNIWWRGGLTALVNPSLNLKSGRVKSTKNFQKCWKTNSTLWKCC